MAASADPATPTGALPAKLLFVITASIVPAALAGVLLIGYDYYDRERSRIERDAMNTARAMIAAVDAELDGATSALHALATSPYLASGNFAGFHGQARAAMKMLEFDNIVLAEESGRQLLNAVQPFGAPLPTQGDPGRLLRVFETQTPVISDLFTGRVTKKLFIGIAVPVRMQGKVRYGLYGGIYPERLSPIVSAQRVPPGWIAGVLDGAGTVVARSREAQRFIGGKGSPELLRGMAAAPEGSFESRTLEGTAVLTVFSRSPVTGWTVAIGIPQRELTLHLVSSLARLFLVTFIVLLTAIGSAVLIGRRVMAGAR